jgi:hypothetical protein
MNRISEIARPSGGVTPLAPQSKFTVLHPEAFRKYLSHNNKKCQSIPTYSTGVCVQKEQRRSQPFSQPDFKNSLVVRKDPRKTKNYQTNPFPISQSPYKQREFFTTVSNLPKKRTHFARLIIPQAAPAESRRRLRANGDIDRRFWRTAGSDRPTGLPRSPIFVIASGDFAKSLVLLRLDLFFWVCLLANGNSDGGCLCVTF